MPEVITRAEAKARGLKRYFNGLNCPHGHTTERMVSSGGCVSCKKQRALCRERQPYEIQFPDAYFASCYRRAIGGCKEEYIKYTNARWMDKWRERTAELEQEAADLSNILKGLRRTASDKFSGYRRRARKDAGIVEETRRRQAYPR